MSGAFLNTQKIGLTFLSVLGLFIGSLSWVDEALASGGTTTRYGQIMARGLYLSDNGNPIIIEMGPGGDEIRQISEAVDDFENPLFLDATTYNTLISLFEKFQAENRNGIAAGATVMTREEYAAADFGTVSVPLVNVQQGGATHQDFAIPKGRLEASTKSVYVRATATIQDPNQLQGNILLQAPIDLRSYQKIDPSLRSVLLDKYGRVRASSAYRLGYKTGFLKDPTAGYRDRVALGPIVGVTVDTTGPYVRYPGYTTEQGHYGISMLIPPCPGFFWDHDFMVTAHIPVIDFDPESPTPVDFYYFMYPDGEFCNGVGENMYGGDLMTLMTGMAMRAIASTTAVRTIRNQDMTVDLAMFKGFGFVTNEYGVELPQGETKYAYTPPNLTRSQPVYLDLNADRQLDAATASATDPRYYDVYLDGSTTGPDNQPRSADLQQVGDNHYTLGYQNQGLLESISFEDLKKTDFYLYRVSTGQRITKIAGLQDERVLENRGGFNYNFLIPGPGGFINWTTGGLRGARAWQEAIGMPRDMIGLEGDFMRPGEQIKIIAVNRPTGYIATTTTTMQTPTYGFLYFPDGTLQLRPPNLKVKVDRIYTVEAGLSQGDKKDYTVGFEGSALTTDTMVSISTEWFDHDGTPLPDDLDGYTGRLAKVTGANSIAGGTVNNFEIKPGQHLQVLKFTGDILGSEHFYVHVFGDKPWDVSSGAGNGPLQFRPDRYVPIKVPIFDEIATRLARNANTYNQQDGNPSVDHVDAVYRWPYRPEMQFSVFDLTVNELNVTDADGNVTDLLNSPTTINTTDQSLQILYDLLANSNDPLATFGPARELVFAVGGDEQLATTQVGQNLTYTNLSQLAEMDSADLMSIRLYQNSDMENVLWEYSLGAIFVEKDDPDYPGLPLRWDDYYPSLGDKQIVIRSFDNTADIAGRLVKAEMTYVKAGGVATVTANVSQANIAKFEMDGSYYRAKFNLSGKTITPNVPYSEATDNIKIKFTLLSKDGSKDEATIGETWYIKNNSNTLLADVLTGKAVFIYDSDSDNYYNPDHKGVTENDTEKKFDTVQDLLNQVVPRKRTVTNYTYIGDDGIFDQGAETALAQFKQHFNVNNTKANTNNSFNKLIKDYSHETDRGLWLNKVVDKEILVGTQLMTTERVVNPTTDGDTGLYELYHNGVKVFVDAMLTEAVRYTSTEPTSNWIARTGETATGTDTHGPGMSYCFGCKDTIEQFNDTVVNCLAETEEQIIERENDTVDPIAIKYRGNVGPLNNVNCQVGGVADRTGQWAGLIDDEWDHWHANVTNKAPVAFNPVTWAGIDCSGFVQHAIVAADSKFEDINTPVQPIQPTPGTELIGSSGFFGSNYAYYQLRATTSDDARIEQQKKLRKGDLVRYRGHISVVYSDGADDKGDYRIIHAYGNHVFDHDKDRSTDRIFSRKVIETRHDIKLPTGYGRVRLWD